MTALLLTACGGSGSSGGSSVQSTATINHRQPTVTTSSQSATTQSTATQSQATTAVNQSQATITAHQGQPSPINTTTAPTSSASFKAFFPNTANYINDTKDTQHIKIGGDLVEVQTLKVTEVTWDGKPMGDFVDLNQLNNGLHKIEQKVHLTADIKNAKHIGVINREYVIYKQPNSIVVGVGTSLAIPSLNKYKNSDEPFMAIPMYGSPTTKLPNAGTYQYTGISFDKDGRQGSLAYRVNFDTQTGQGRAVLGDYQVSLNEGKIESSSEFADAKKDALKYASAVKLVEEQEKWGIYQGFDNIYQIKSTASTPQNKEGTYQLLFMGDQAQELAGFAVLNDEHFGLGATKQ